MKALNLSCACIAFFAACLPPYVLINLLCLIAGLINLLCYFAEHRTKP